MNKLLLGVALCCAPLLNTACSTSATTATPAPPNSMQSTVALTNKTIADANLAGVQTIISLRDSGKISQANTVPIQTWLALVANTTKGIGGVLAKPEPWTQQKTEILTLLGTVTAPTIVTTIDPQAQAVVTQILTLIAELKVQVNQ